MAQNVFSSIYTKDFIWWENVERTKRTIDFNETFIPEKASTFLDIKNIKVSAGPEAQAIIKDLHERRWKSTYKADFSKDKFAPSEESQDPLQDDELMDSMARVLDPPQQQLLPPPPTSQRVYAYCPVRHFKSGRSFYMDVHSKPAYDILKRNIMARGLCRLAPSPPRHEEPDYSRPLCLKGKTYPPKSWIHRQPDPWAARAS